MTDPSLEDARDVSDRVSSVDSNYSALQDNPRLALRRFIVFIAGTATVADLKRKTEAVYHDLYPQDPKVRVIWVQDNSFYDLADSYQVADVFSDSHAFFTTVELANVEDAPRVDMAQIVANHRRTATEQLLYASPVASGPVSPHVSLLSTKRSASPIDHSALKRIKVVHHPSPSPAPSKNAMAGNPATAVETSTHPVSNQICMGSLTGTTTMVTPLASSPEISANPLFENIEKKPPVIPKTMAITPVSCSGESQTRSPIANSRKQEGGNLGSDTLKTSGKAHLTTSSSSDSDTSSESESRDTADAPSFPTKHNAKLIPPGQVSMGHKPQNPTQTRKPTTPLVTLSHAIAGRRSVPEDSSSDEDDSDSGAVAWPKPTSVEAPLSSTGVLSKTDQPSSTVRLAKPPITSSSSSGSDSDASTPVQSSSADAIPTVVKTADRFQGSLVQPNAARPAPTLRMASQYRASSSNSDSDSDTDTPPKGKQTKPQARVVTTVKKPSQPVDSQKYARSSSSSSDSTSSSLESDSDNESLAKTVATRLKAQGGGLTPNPKSTTLSSLKSKTLISTSAGSDSDSDRDSFDKSSPSLASAGAPYIAKGATATKPGGFTSLSAMAASGKFHKLSTSSQLIPGIPSSAINRAFSRPHPPVQSSSELESSSDGKANSDASDTTSDSDDSDDDETPKAPTGSQSKGTFRIKFAQSASKKKKRSSKSRLLSLAF
ncbi:hypothetical protein IWQ61_007584 [Dispira simplex]|nr:hypothetical protein IWQ61_007584 [Dispira simplex]